MKVTQVKPEVIGYVQTEFMGESFFSVNELDIRCMASIAVSDMHHSRNPGKIKSKFRPIYKKES